MIDFIYKRSVVSIREMAFGSYSDILLKGCTVAYMHSSDQVCKLQQKPNCLIELQDTLVTDLNKSEDELFSLIGKTCRYEIRRAEKEDIVVTMYGSDIPNEILVQFENTYNNMFSSKGMTNKFNHSLFTEGCKNKQVFVSCSTSIEKSCSVFHAYLCDGKNTVLMYSASPIWDKRDKQTVNKIGRMNKHLHWKDILEFKRLGYKCYEWGGLKSFSKPNGIDLFKMEFGGNHKQYFNYTIGKGLLGLAYVYLVRRKNHERIDN